jgi:pheromone shutdown-related protein TraB
MITKIKLDNPNFQFGKKEITIIGTAHVSKKNIQQVQNTIIELQPEVVGVELDRARFIGILQPTKAREVKFKDIFKSRDPFYFLFTFILGSYQKKIARKLKTTAGGEMLAAIKTAKIIDSKILLLDRNINITLKKLLNNINFKDKLKLLFGGLFLNKKEKEILSKINLNNLLNEVEEDKDNSETINNIMKILSKKFNKIKKILIDERDEFMAYNILQTPYEKIVIIVGAGHVEGIIKNLNKKRFNIKRILNINHKYK